MSESFLWTPQTCSSMESVHNVVFCSLFLWTLCCYFQKNKTKLTRDPWCAVKATQHLQYTLKGDLQSKEAIICLTSEKTRVINWSRVDILVTHLVFVPTVKSHIFLPLFEPVTVHKVPAEKASSIISAPIKQDGTLLISQEIMHQALWGNSKLWWLFLLVRCW